MFDLNYGNLILNNANLIYPLQQDKTFRNILGITLYCGENPAQHLNTVQQVNLLKLILDYYMQNVVNPGLEEVENVWDNLELPSDLQPFFDQYVNNIEVQIEHKDNEEEYLLDGLSSGLLSL
jgi:hypothetical protein